MRSFISVIIACCNGTNYLTDAIKSICKQNERTEILVVDDGSTDKTSLLAKDLGCSVISIPHSGLSAARNVGIRQAKGDYILFIDHDDIMRNGALHELLETIKQHPTVSAIMAKAEDFISPELSQEERADIAPKTEPYYGLLSGAVLLRRSVFEQIDAFREDLSSGQTMDLIQRMESAGMEIVKIPLIACSRRLHTTNMGRTMRQQEHKDYAAILRGKLRRP